MVRNLGPRRAAHGEVDPAIPVQIRCCDSEHAESGHVARLGAEGAVTVPGQYADGVPLVEVVIVREREVQASVAVQIGHDEARRAGAAERGAVRERAATRVEVQVDDVVGLAQSLADRDEIGPAIAVQVRGRDVVRLVARRQVGDRAHPSTPGVELHHERVVHEG